MSALSGAHSVQKCSESPKCFVLNNACVWFWLQSSVSPLSALLFKFCTQYYSGELTVLSTNGFSFYSLPTSYLLPLLSMQNAACPDLCSSSSLELCYCRCSVKRTFAWSDECSVSFLCWFRREKKCSLFWCAGTASRYGSFLSRAIMEPCLHSSN